MVASKKRHNWLARAIIWSGVTERQTCCFLCKITMSITSFFTALSFARSLDTVKWFLVIGILLDLAREAIDLSLGRPFAAALKNVDLWIADTNFILGMKVWVYGCFGGWFIFVFIIGLVYSLSVGIEHPVVLTHVLNWVGRALHKLVLYTGLPPLDALGTSSSDAQASVELRRSFVLVIMLSTVAYVFFGTVFLARRLSVINAAWARKKGARSYPDQAALIAIYITQLFVTLIVAYMYNDVGHLSCVTNTECSQNVKELFQYSIMTGFLATNLIAMASTAESGCLEWMSAQNNKTGTM